MAATTKVLTTSGKRKTATARATVRKGTGIIRINKVPLDIVQPELVRLKVSEPVLIAGTVITKSLNIDVDVRGGGIMGQAEAARCAIAPTCISSFSSSGAFVVSVAVRWHFTRSQNSSSSSRMTA